MNSITYPFHDSKWFIKHLYSYLFFIPFAGIFLLLGYQLRTIKENSTEDKDSLPEWDNRWALIKDGFFTSLIILFYIAIPLILLIITTVFLFFKLRDIEPELFLETITGNTHLFIAFIIMIISLFFTVLSSLLIPMATGIYAVKGSFWAAINTTAVLWNILKYFRPYIPVILIPLFLSILWTVISLLLNMIPVIGQIITIILYIPVKFYINLVASKLTGQIFKRHMVKFNIDANVTHAQ